MKIAVFLEQGLETGGGYQHAFSTVLLLNKMKSPQYEFLFFTTIKTVEAELQNHGVLAQHIALSFLDKVQLKLLQNSSFYLFAQRFRLPTEGKLDRILKSYGIDLVYFTTPSVLTLKIFSHNFILTIWDLNHLDFPEFPEFRGNMQFEVREKYFAQSVPKAVKLIANSEFGKKNIAYRYNIYEDRVVNIPFTPTSSVSISAEEYEKGFIDIKRKYEVQGDYIFYPAQFWPHKNHIYIVDGIKHLLNDYGIRVNVIFAGKDRGTLDYVLSYAEDAGVRDQIYPIGFVPNEEIPYLYKQSLCLVMPTFCGLTNLPSIEAFAMEVPVIYSDRPVIRDYVEGAALLIDLSNPATMAQHVFNLTNDPELRQELINKGKEKLGVHGEDNYWEEIKSILDEYKVFLKSWKRC